MLKSLQVVMNSLHLPCLAQNPKTPWPLLSTTILGNNSITLFSMNLIMRTAFSTPKTLFILPRCTILTQQLSTTSNYTSTKATLEQPLTSPSTWPRPSAIPYQPKLQNSVNLFGTIQSPIQLHSTPDGKNIAATLIAQKDGAFIADSSASLLIPVLFEGDLAHTVASHVKQNDCVYVSGKLSLNPLPFVLSENEGKFHLVGNDINFVEGLDMQACSTIINNILKEQVENHNVVEEQVGILDRSTPVPVWVDKILSEFNSENKVEVLNIEKKRVSGGIATFGSWRDLVKNPANWRDYREKKSIGLVKAKHLDFKHTTKESSLWLNNAPEWVVAGLAGLNVGGKGKKEDGWKNLVQNPENWWDNRSSKINVKTPDFKHKETGEGLWLNSKPDWVLPIAIFKKRA